MCFSLIPCLCSPLHIYPSKLHMSSFEYTKSLEFAGKQNPGIWSGLPAVWPGHPVFCPVCRLWGRATRLTARSAGSADSPPSVLFWVNWGSYPFVVPLILTSPTNRRPPWTPPSAPSTSPRAFPPLESRPSSLGT